MSMSEPGPQLLGRERVEGKDLGLGHIWAGLRVWVLEGEWHGACNGDAHFSQLWSPSAGSPTAELSVMCVIPGLPVSPNWVQLLDPSTQRKA